MRLDITKIDDRIRKLQDLKRLLSDSEMTSVLLECVVSNEQESHRSAPPPPIARAAEAPDFTSNVPDGVESVLNEVMEGTRWNKREVKPR
jgi:hypothetical protein